MERFALTAPRKESIYFNQKKNQVMEQKKVDWSIPESQWWKANVRGQSRGEKSGLFATWGPGDDGEVGGKGDWRMICQLKPFRIGAQILKCRAFPVLLQIHSSTLRAFLNSLSHWVNLS